MNILLQHTLPRYSASALGYPIAWSNSNIQFLYMAEMG